MRFDSIPIAAILLIAFYYYANRYLDYSKIVTFFTNVLSINFLAYICFLYDIQGVYTLIIMMIIGLLMKYLPIAINRDVFKIQGNIVFGIAGLILTFRDVWNDLDFISSPDIYSITFAILYLIYLLLLTRKGNIISLVFICATIFRYYFDTMYDFMPKSMFFITGGFILVGFGYYFEKMRKERGEDIYEE